MNHVSAGRTTVRVRLSERSYDIEIGRDCLHEAATIVADRLSARHALLITDENVRDPHALRVMSALSDRGVRTDLLAVPAGEESKSAAQAERLWNALAERNADRKSIVVAVGGGVVGDLAGFVAATFARGLRLVQVPTTLVAQVDSSVGGKVGINLPLGKNLVGAFWQPAAVLIDVGVLDTLPQREYRSGLAEVVKYGVIRDAAFFEFLEQKAPAVLQRQEHCLRHIVQRCCQLKADVVEQDERETTGLRAMLNYGHTFAHAFETVSGYGKLLHGEAVAIGMECAARLAHRLGRVELDFVHRQRALLTALGLPTKTAGLAVDALLEAMGRDKKAQHGCMRLILPTRLGHVELVDGVDAAVVRAVLSE
jgi:3-dehydroquinate synthase